MKNKLTSFTAAGFLLSIVACGGSDGPSDSDASLAHDAQSGSGGATASGGKPGTGGALGGSGGAIGTGGASPATGGAIGTGGLIGTGGTGGLTVDAGGSPIDGGSLDGGPLIDGGHGDVAIDGPSDQVCGGIAGLPCPKGQFCEYTAGTCSSIADATGICATPSEICATVYQPVCGCDGKTYGNDCERRGAGVSKKAEGACTTAGKMCAGIAGIPCSKGQFCEFPTGNCGRTPDGAGTCAATGKDVACPAMSQPVCGCDGKTYGNDCERQAAGVSKVSDGACAVVDGGSTG